MQRTVMTDRDAQPGLTSDDPGGGGSANPAQTLLIVLGFDLVITLIEFIGAINSGSLVLWENFGTGLLDGVLIALNIWGLRNETHYRQIQGRRIAYYSDVILGLVFTVAILAGVFQLMVNTNGVVNGMLVFGIAIAATLMNSICAYLCPKQFINGRSARLKMKVGAWVGAATVFTGLTIHWLQWYWVDPVATVIVGFMVLRAIHLRLAERGP